MSATLSTTTATIIFPLSQASDRFYTDFYSPDLTDGQLSPRDIAQFLSKIDEEHSNFRIKQAVAWCCYFLTLMAVSYGSFHFILYFLKGYELVVFVWILVIGGNSIAKPIENRIKKDLKTRCQKIANEQNRTLRRKGLRWNLPKEFPIWIELCRDKKKKRNAGSQEQISNTEIIKKDREAQTQSQQSLDEESQKKDYFSLFEDNNED